MILQDTQTPVVVLKLEHYGSLGIIRSLGKLGILVYGVDANPAAPGFSSRFCVGKFLWDIDNVDAERTVDFLLQVGQTIGKPSILIPTSDETATLVAENATALSEWFIFPRVCADLVHTLCSKKKMFFLATRVGIPTARTEFPQSRDDVLQYLRTATFPVMLKGIDGRRLELRTGKKMVIVHNDRELLDRYDAMEDSESPNLMLQEYVPGGDDSVWMFNGYFNEDSQCLVGFMGKKIRQNPVYTGMTSLGICLRNETVAETTKKFMKAIGYRGILDIGYRYDKRDNQYKVLDVNPRIGATFRLFVGTNGMDVARALYLDLTGQPVPQDTLREGRKWIVEDKDIRSCYQYFRDGKLTVSEWLRSFRGVEEAGYFALSDQRPFWRMWWNHCRKTLASLLGKAKSKGLMAKETKRKSFAGLRIRRKVQSEPTAVVISAGGSPGAYDIVRTLGMAGIRTSVASSQSNDIAFYSRYCGERVVLPEFRPEHYEDILKALKELSTHHDEPPVLYYASDPELSFVWRFRDQLQPFYRFLLPPNEMLEQLFNKVLFGRFAMSHGLPIPPTTTVVGGIDESVLSTIKFPCIVKPAYSEDWIWDTEEQREKFGPYKKALRRFATPEELLAFCDALPKRSSGYLIQSYIDGRDEKIVSFHGYFNEQSQCLGCFLGRKIRTYPPYTGGSVYVQTIQNPKLAKLSIEYLQRFGFQGIVKIDYKWDESEQEFKILEINPRYNLWELLGAYAGVNLIYLTYRHQRRERVDPQFAYATPERLLYVKQDLRAFLNGYRKAKEWTVWAYIVSFLKRKHYRVFNLNDPLPSVFSIIDFIKRNAARMARRVALGTTSLGNNIRMNIKISNWSLVKLNTNILSDKNSRTNEGWWNKRRKLDTGVVVEVVQERSALEVLAGEWNALASMFEMPLLRHEWFAACAEAFSSKETPWVAVLRSSGRIKAIAPLALARVGRFSRLELIGTSILGEPCGMLYSDENSLTELINTVVATGKPLMFRRLKAPSTEIDKVISLRRETSFVVFSRSSRTPVIPIETSWKEYEKSLSSSRRSSVRRAHRRAEEYGGVEVQIISPNPENVDDVLQEVFSVEAAGWKARTGTAINMNPLLKSFFTRYAYSAAQLGILRLGILRINGKAVAAALGVEYAQRFWLLKIGYDEQWARCSPGILLIHEVIRWTYERGLQGVEFLGSDEPWIHMWTDRVHSYQTVSTYPVSISGLFWLGFDLLTILSRKMRSAKTLLRELWLRVWKEMKQKVLNRIAATHVAGPTLADALLVSRYVADKGWGVTLCASDGLNDGAKNAVSQYRLAAEAIRAENIDGVLSIKPLTFGCDFGMFKELLEVAKAYSIRIQFDAQRPDSARASFELLEKAAAFYRNVGCTLPSRWERSTVDAERAVAMGISVRVVKGQWRDAVNPHLDGRARFLELIERLAGRACYVSVATHDAPLARASLEKLKQAQTSCELELLVGLPLHPTHVAEALGVPVRIYIPYGKALLPYNVSQLPARPAIMGWVLRDLSVGRRKRIYRESMVMVQ